MKTTLIAATFALITFAAAAQQTITLAWDYPAPSTNITFKVYSGPNATPGTAGWQVVTNVAGDAAATTYQVTIPVVKPAGTSAKYFAVTAIENKGVATEVALESDFSNVVFVKATPPGKNMTIRVP